jgi:hypothetical protein
MRVDVHSVADFSAVIERHSSTALTAMAIGTPVFERMSGAGNAAELCWL